MTSALNGIALAVVVKVTFTTALGLAAAGLARGKRASLRHALLAASFGVAFLLPIAVVLMPPFRIPVPAEAENWAPALPLVTDSDAARPAATLGTRARVTPEAPRGGAKLSLADILFVGWGSGFALFLLPVIAGLSQIRALRRSGLPWRQGQSIAESLALRAGIHRPVEVLLHDALPGPMTCGVAHPVIVLPRDAETWNADDLNRAIVHELEHVHRGDSITRCLARAVFAVYWFHPLVWIAWRKLGLEAERACDDAVLRDSEGTAYADQLVALAKRMAADQRPQLLAMASHADLATRVGAVLDDRQQRDPAGISALAVACAAAVVLVIGVSPLGLVAAPQTTSAGTLNFDVASVKLVTVPQGVTVTEGGGVMIHKGLGADPGRVASTGGPGTDDPDRIHYPLVNLKELVRRAWSSYFEIEGPGWLSTRVVAVDATIAFDTQAWPTSIL